MSLTCDVYRHIQNEHTRLKKRLTGVTKQWWFLYDISLQSNHVTHTYYRLRKKQREYHTLTRTLFDYARAIHQYEQSVR